MAPEDFDTNGAVYINSGCIYIYPVVFIYLRLYLYISGCIYTSPAVFIYIPLYLYISGCIDISLAVLIIIISPVLLNFDTNGAPYDFVKGASHLVATSVRLRTYIECAFT